jgi:hypothetical protein
MVARAREVFAAFPDLADRIAIHSRMRNQTRRPGGCGASRPV